jgi:hypothetical protein
MARQALSLQAAKFSSTQGSTSVTSALGKSRGSHILQVEYSCGMTTMKGATSPGKHQAIGCLRHTQAFPTGHR